MKYLLAGVAAASLAVSPAFAQPGKGNGNGNGNGNGKPAAAQNSSSNGNGNGNGPAGNNAKPQKQQGPAAAMRDSPSQARSGGNGNGNNGATRSANPGQKANNGNAKGNAPVRAAAGGNGNRNTADSARPNAGNQGSYESGSRRIIRSADRTDVFFRPDRRDYGLIDGCPPGLAKKRNGCTPPGLDRQKDSRRFLSYRPSYFGFGSLNDGRYYYGDGFLYRLGQGDRIASYIPLLGGALSVGSIWPNYYQTPSVPAYYSDYYGLGPVGNYGYANDVLYRVNPETAAITSIAALLTGDEFAIGQPMPAGYDVYNVPYAYRDRYYDRPDAMYRYSDGYVYQVDPETRLIAAAIELVL